jgi:hypothetical protein
MKVATVESILKDLEASLPVPVQGWIVETGPDATNDDAVWVWAILRDEDLKRETRNIVREAVREAVQGDELDKAPWVYVRFRGASETLDESA